MKNLNTKPEFERLVQNGFPPQSTPEKSPHHQSSSQFTLAKLSDKELYKKCRFYGSEARKWSRRFAALLPEVARRELYKKHGFYSIFEFAAKLAGMKHETVIDILRVAKKLEDKPFLRQQMETHGWSKLKVIATIATKDNEKMLAEKVERMSLATLSTFVQEIRKQNNDDVQSRIDSAGGQPLSGAPLGAHEQQSITTLSSGAQKQQPLSAASTSTSNRIFVRLLLAPKNELKLKELQKKLSREQKAPVDLNEVIEVLLDAYEQRIQQAPASALQAGAHMPDVLPSSAIKKSKAAIPTAMPNTSKPMLSPMSERSTPPKPASAPHEKLPKADRVPHNPSRYIPAKIRRPLRLAGLHKITGNLPSHAAFCLI